MFVKHIQVFLLSLVLAILLSGLSGCTSLLAGENNMPDRVQITIHVLDPKAKQQVRTLTDVSLVRQFYTTAVTLPLLPRNAVCTMELGTSYTLTFLQGGKTLTTVTAQRFSCRKVFLAGEKQERVATKEFWSRLDQAISKSQ